MNRSLDNFRALLILSAVTWAISVGIGYAEMPLADGQLYYLDGSGAGSLINPEAYDLVWYAYLFIYAVAHLLAFFFVWFSRPLFVISFLLNIFMAIVGGLSVLEPWSSTAWNIHSLVFHFTFGMLFFSPAVTKALGVDKRSHILSQPPESAAPIQLVNPTDGPN